MAFAVMCLINRHRPRRDQVEWNGFHYVAVCRHCEKPIVRMPKGGWRLDSDRSAESSV